MMDYAVMLYFDSATEQRIKSTIDRLVESGAVNATYRDTGLRPHLTLAEFSTQHFESVETVLNHFAKTWPAFTIRLGSIGVFPLEPAVLFYAPIVDDVLFSLHRNINHALKRYCTEFSALYQDRSWVAHCTLALNLTTEEVQNGIAILSPDFEVIDAHFTGIEIFSCCPLNHIASYPLPVVD